MADVVVKKQKTTHTNGVPKKVVFEERKGLPAFEIPKELPAKNRYSDLFKQEPQMVFPSTDLQKVLTSAVKEQIFVAEAFSPPAAWFYDLDLLDWYLNDMKAAFGETFHHHIAVKANSITGMLQYMYSKHGVGLECCSIGEVLQCLHCGVPPTHIVYDSPCKSIQELEFVILQKIYCNLDNYIDVERTASIIEKHKLTKDDLGPIGLRINPLVGSGEIKALSVSTADSKFGIPITEGDKIISMYKKYDWMTSLHCHVGSGGMGIAILTAGVKVMVDFALKVNQSTSDQIRFLDIGGGKPVNYWSDSVSAEKAPDFNAYADALRAEAPELFSGKFKVVTEFGQAIANKLAFLASTIEWIKGTEERPIYIVHFGADACPRQIYDHPSHERRVEAYKADGSVFSEEDCKKTGFVYGEYNGSRKKNTNANYDQELPFNYGVGGPLCFQGDFVSKNIRLPAGLDQGDIVVMKDAGGSTLSMFSRHCSRLAPPVYGFRWEGDDVTFSVVKPQESFETLTQFMGPLLKQN